MTTHNDGLLRTKQSLYGRIVAGNLSFAVLVLVSLIFLVIPWDTLYTLQWYKGYISLMSNISTNLLVIPQTATRFPNYAVSFVAFINLFGLIALIFSSISANKHTHILKEHGIKITLDKFKLIGGIIFFLLFFLILTYNAYTFSGESFLQSDLFTKSKWRFIGIYTACWWGASFMLFGITCMLSLTKNR